jgi:hypothetical protein
MSSLLFICFSSVALILSTTLLSTNISPLRKVGSNSYATIYLFHIYILFSDINAFNNTFLRLRLRIFCYTSYCSTTSPMSRMLYLTKTSNAMPASDKDQTYSSLSDEEDLEVGGLKD